MTPTPPPASKRTSQAKEPSTQLPLIRVKRIIKVDKDIQKVGNEAATLITRATESFIQYLAEQVANLVYQTNLQAAKFSRMDGRKTLQYKDMANAVARIDHLEFLSDIVPRTMTYKSALKRKEQLLQSPDAEHNGSRPSHRKKPRKSRKEDDRPIDGGIERFFSRKSGNGKIEDEGTFDEDSMDVDG